MANAAESRNTDVFDESGDSSNARTVHRLRANSSIMKVNKVLGKCSRRPELLARGNFN